MIPYLTPFGRLIVALVTFAGAGEAQAAEPVDVSPCTAEAERSFQFIGPGLAARTADSLFAGHGMDFCAAFPLDDSVGEPLGLVVAMDRQPIAGGDADTRRLVNKINRPHVGITLDFGHSLAALENPAECAR